MTSSRRAHASRAQVLVLNAGSSTLKASLIEPAGLKTISTASVTWGSAGQVPDPGAALAAVVGAMGDREGAPAIAAIGHRVVHGGERFREPSLIDDRALDAILGLSDLAPLHNPPAVATIEAARRRFPDVPHVACFDTAFHASLPERAYRYPVPERWLSEWGIRRFGFHGLSTQWAVRRSGELLRIPTDRLHLVVAHLGGGCSVTAVDRGRSVATSMGFTPLEGVMMGTRSGSIDPGIPLWLLEHDRLSLAELAETLNHGSGLAGVAGSDDVPRLLRAATAGDTRARLAIAMFEERAAAGIAASASELVALDAVVFTGGIGEHAASIRSGIVRRLAVLGVRPIARRRVSRDRVLSGHGQRPAVLRVESREDLVIAEATLGVASRGGRNRRG